MKERVLDSRNESGYPHFDIILIDLILWLFVFQIYFSLWTISIGNQKIIEIDLFVRSWDNFKLNRKAYFDKANIVQNYRLYGPALQILLLPVSLSSMLFLVSFVLDRIELFFSLLARIPAICSNQCSCNKRAIVR